MSSLTSRVLLLAVAAAFLPATALACDDTKPLMAGQHTQIGEVTVTDDGSTLTVSYDLSDNDWGLTGTHIYVSNDTPDSGAPGQFDYGDDSTSTFDVSYDIDITGFDGGSLWVAAHGVAVETVDGVDLDAFGDSLPDDGEANPQHKGNPDSYWEITIGEGDLAGTYDGWCVDTSHSMSSNTDYTIEILSSYDDIPDGVIDKPENLDQVNYLLNQDVVGATSPTCGDLTETYTYGDMQRAIWELIDDNPSTAGLGSWSTCRVAELVADAAANGVGFEPGCDEEIAVILVPVSSTGAIVAQVIIAQVTIIGVIGECDLVIDEDGDEETAWATAEGDSSFYNSKGKVTGWGTYWEYELCD